MTIENLGVGKGGLPPPGFSDIQRERGKPPFLTLSFSILTKHSYLCVFGNEGRGGLASQFANEHFQLQTRAFGSAAC
jgi:hypothetical protein